MQHSRFSPEEDVVIKQCFAKGFSDQRIADQLAALGYYRSRGSIQSRRRTLRLFPGGKSFLPPRKDTPDLKFKKAMLAAIGAGKEAAIMGVVKDRRPWALKRIQAEPVNSGCSSPESWV